MRAVLKLEAIGDNYFAYLRFGQRVNPQYERRKWQMTKPSLRPWVARLQPDLQRKFLEPVRDYTQATGTGARGIFLYYALPPGFYEVNDRISWQRARRYFIRVEGMTVTEITREEAIVCLTSATSELTSSLPHGSE